MTTDQLKTIGMARRWGEKTIPGFDEAQFRLVLRNVGKVKEDAEGRVSTKALDNRGLEFVMAWFESVGYHQPGSEPGYWTAKANRHAKYVSARELRMIEQLATECPYPLGSLVWRLSNHRTHEVQELTRQQGYALIEALKKIVQRETAKRTRVAKPDSDFVSSAPSVVALSESECNQIEQDVLP